MINNMKGEWRPVPGFKMYRINIDDPRGRCRRVYKNGKVKELNNKPDKRNRLNWVFSNGRIQKSAQAARWIALTYPELVQNEFFEGAQIDHIDTNPMNNHPSNLRWTTPKENTNNPLTLQKKKGLLKGRVFSPETIEKMSLARRGKIPGEGTRRKMSAARKGHIVTEETRKKIAAGHSIPVAQYTTDNVFVARYNSAREAGELLGIRFQGISKCATGERKTYKGYVWRKILE